MIGWKKRTSVEMENGGKISGQVEPTRSLFWSKNLEGSYIEVFS